jgi:hypothetical protein
MKQCPACKKLLPLDQWYNGSTRCKSCRVWAARGTRENNPETVKAKDARFYRNHREKILAAKAEWRKANKHKTRAHTAVFHAMQSGRLIKKSCEVCGNEKVQAHHEDYSQQLSVRWLCVRHHKRIHGPSLGL